MRDPLTSGRQQLPEATSVRFGATFNPPHTLYPVNQPYDTGWLDVGDGHRLRYEQSGNPSGKPVVFLHGGPGGGGGDGRRRFFDPVRYRVICFDQRGCGDSSPHVAEGAAGLAANTTWHLVADVERLRAHLDVPQWQVFGGSWGSALALAYAQQHPDRVSELVLRGIFTLRRSELDWFYNGGAAAMAPEWWHVFRTPLEQAGLGACGDNIEAYHQLLWHDDPQLAEAAAVAWTTWEGATSSLLFNSSVVRAYEDGRFALAFARIENHFFRHAGWFEEGQLLDGVERIRHIPCVIVQGRYDLCCPAITAWELSQAWPEAQLRMVLAGHSAFEPNIASELIAATDRFSNRR